MYENEKVQEFIFWLEGGGLIKIGISYIVLVAIFLSFTFFVKTMSVPMVPEEFASGESKPSIKISVLVDNPGCFTAEDEVEKAINEYEIYITKILEGCDKYIKDVRHILVSKSKLLAVITFFAYFFFMISLILFCVLAYYWSRIYLLNRNFYLENKKITENFCKERIALEKEIARLKHDLEIINENFSKIQNNVKGEAERMLGRELKKAQEKHSKENNGLRDANNKQRARIKSLLSEVKKLKTAIKRGTR